MLVRNWWRTFSSSIINPKGSYTSGQDFLNVSNVQSDDKVKSLTPNYWELLKAGEVLPVNNYSRTIWNKGGFATFGLWSKIFSKDSWREVFLSEGEVSTEATLPYSTVSALLAAYSSQINVLNQDAKATLNNHISNVILDVPVEIGEAKETARLLVGTVQDLANFALDWKLKTSKIRRQIKNLLTNPGSRNNQRRAILKKLANDLNGKYLEFTYGWNPLMGSFSDLSDILKERMDKPRPRKKISGKATFNDVILGTPFPLASSTSQLPTISVRRRTTLKIEVWYGGLLIENEVEPRVSLTRELGLTVDNVVPALWELTRLSFIADYFTNIGNVLGNLRFAPSRLQTVTLYRSIKIVMQTDIVYSSIAHLNVPSNYIKTDGYTTGVNVPSELIYFNRIPVTAAGLLVAPIARIPSWDHVFKSLSVAAAVSRVFK